MRNSRRLGLIPLLALALPASGLGAGGAYDPARVAWSRIELEASKLWLTARSEVDFERRPAAEAVSELFAPARGQALRPAGAASGLIAIRTTFLGRDSRVRFWFDPADARALERSELKLARKRSRLRVYRYAPGGVHAHTREPGAGEEERSHAGWSGVHDRWVAFPASLDGAVVTEPAALLYAVPAGSLDAPGDALEMHVFSRGKVSVVDVAVAALEEIEVDYVEVSAAGERPVAGKAETLRVTLRPRPLPGAKDEGGIQLLGLEGDIDLYLDPRTRAPLLVTGRIEFAGRVRLWAQRVILK